MKTISLPENLDRLRHGWHPRRGAHWFWWVLADLIVLLSIAKMALSRLWRHRPKHLRLSLIVAYLLIASFGCLPAAIAAHESLKLVGIESEIAVASVHGTDRYGHAFIIVDDNCYEPRYLGLYLQSNIDYQHPYNRYNTTPACLAENPLSRIPRTIIILITEKIKINN